MALQTIYHIDSEAGPYYAYPISELTFGNWATERVELTDPSLVDLYSANVDTTLGPWLIFRGAAAPTSWGEYVGSDVILGVAKTLVAELSASKTSLTLNEEFASNSTLYLVQGDDYNTNNGRAVEKVIEIAGFDFTDIVEVNFGASRRAGEPLINGSPSLQGTAVGSATLRLEFSRAQTSVANGQFLWSVTVVDSGNNTTTIDGGRLFITPSYTSLS